MLEVVPCSWFTHDHDVFANLVHLCRIEMAWLREAGSFSIHGEPYRIQRESMWGAYVLCGSQGEVCRAAKVSAWRRSFVLAFGGDDYDLVPESLFRRGFVVRCEGREIGHLRPAGLFTRKLLVSLPDTMPRQVQVFMTWLVLMLWRRGRNAKD